MTSTQTQGTPSPADFMAMTDGPDFDVEQPYGYLVVGPHDPQPGDEVQIYPAGQPIPAEPSSFRLPTPLGPGSVEPASTEEPGNVALLAVHKQLERIAGMIQAPTELQAQLDETVLALNDAHLSLDAQRALIAEVLEAIKKSTSQVANKVRAILQPEPLAPLPTEQPNETEPVAISKARTAELVAELESEVPEGQEHQPADDAPVEVWRQFVRGRKSFLGVDVDQLNKSQIRTRLQLPHPSEGQAADQSAEG